MGLKQFDLAALSEIDSGRIRVAFNQALARCENDCRDRPAVKAKRSVTLEVELVPMTDPKGDLESVDVQCQIKERIPSRKSKAYNMNATGDGLVYNELSPEDADQGTFFEDDGKGGLRASAEEKGE